MEEDLKRALQDRCHVDTPKYLGSMTNATEVSAMF
jgi:hypothetical protein